MKIQQNNMGLTGNINAGKSWVFFLLVLISFFQGKLLPAQGTETVKAIDQLMTKGYPADQPGATVLIAKDGEVLFRKSYGKASLSPNVDMKPEHIFRIGSISKQFTSVSILKLVQEGKINLHDDLTKYLPDYPTQGKSITVENLLTHTSGIKNYTSLPELMTPANKAAIKTITERLNDFKDFPVDFKAGEKFKYSNSGYFLLGLIIEKVSGLSYGDYVKKNLLEPLRMKSTFYDGASLDKRRAAVGYKQGKNGFEVADYVHSSMPYSAGALATNVDDLWKWSQAVFSYKVLPKQTIEAAWEPFTLKNGTKINYGYGWSMGRLDELKVVDHGGSIDGFLGYALNIPDQNLFVGILTNSTSSDPGGQAFDIARLVLRKPIQRPVTTAVDEKSLNEYTGVYQVNSDETCIISLEDHKLYFKQGRMDKQVALPYQNDRFFFNGTPDRLLFGRDQDKKITSLTYTSFGWIPTKALKTDLPLPVERTELNLDLNKFDEYVGEYELAPNYIVTVWREGSVFKAQATGQRAFDIFAETETKFFLKEVEATVEFTKDQRQKVNGLVLTLGGRSTPGKKTK